MMTTQTSHNLLNFDRESLAQFLQARGEKAFRAKQIFSRLHRDGAQTIDACLQDFPKAARAALADSLTTDELPLAADLPASDGVRKLLFQIDSQQQVEAVIIPEARRTTLCVSSQAGCALACRFCLTGKQGFARNLSAAEILSQLRTANRLLIADGSAPISNVVMMGMGEPLLNSEAVFPALRVMTDDLAYHLPPRRVTISTSGIVPVIYRMRECCDVALAISLHAASDSLRDDLMPINRKYPLKELLAACAFHISDRPRAFITFEYVMLNGINDSLACARDIIKAVHGLRCKLNLIPFNTFDDASFTPTPRPQILAFRDRLMKGGVMTTIRKTRGHDILAACGQLAGEVQARTFGLQDNKRKTAAIRIQPAAPQA